MTSYVQLKKYETLVSYSYTNLMNVVVPAIILCIHFCKIPYSRSKDLINTKVQENSLAAFLSELRVQKLFAYKKFLVHVILCHFMQQTSKFIYLKKSRKSRRTKSFEAISSKTDRHKFVRVRLNILNFAQNTDYIQNVHSHRSQW